MLIPGWQLQLIMAQGLPAAAAGEGVRLLREWGITELTPEARRRLTRELMATGWLKTGKIEWAGEADIGALQQRLAGARTRLLWRLDADYPEKLRGRLDGKAPPWVWLRGDGGRLELAACSMIGSRHTSNELLQAATRLSHALAEAGAPVASGLAGGADAAAHRGAVAGAAGTIVIPASGILSPHWQQFHGKEERMTCLALDRPDAGFSAGLAIRRNDLIAALGDGLVLVASGLQGGSWYALRWALAHRLPIWCFSAGQHTPPGNAYLLKRKEARPLLLAEPVERWVEQILTGLTGPRLQTGQKQLELALEERPDDV